MTDNDKTVRGPMHIEATPLMVTADVSPLVADNTAELLDLLASDEFFEEFVEAAATEVTEHDGRTAAKLAFEELAARLVERLATKIALTGPQAMRVAGRMAKLGQPLAARHAETAAAVMKGATLIKHPSHAATRKHLAANPFPKQDGRWTA